MAVCGGGDGWLDDKRVVGSWVRSSGPVQEIVVLLSICLYCLVASFVCPDPESPGSRGGQRTRKGREEA